MITMIIIVTILALGSLAVINKYRSDKFKGRGISILVPFQCSDKQNVRVKNWEWLERYWEAQLPGAEIIMGKDYEALETGIPFSKSVAVNNAASKASGDIFVIVDADGYIPAERILKCADEIRRAQKKGQRLWYVPYREFYRLTEEASRLVLNSDPANPYVFSSPPSSECVQDPTGANKGHWFGALIQIVPRSAFEEVGGWDTRMRGWGGEDHAAMRAFDTLYWPHKTLPTQVLHLWHPMFNPAGASSTWVDWKSRTWEGQTSAGANDALSGRYYHAMGNRAEMRKLVDAGLGGDTSEVPVHQHNFVERHQTSS